MAKIPKKVRYSKLFEKQFVKAPQNIQQAFRKRRKLFEQDPHTPQLHNHALSGKRKGLRSINITGDWRALYEEQAGSNDLEIIALFQAIGTHSQLYK